MQRENDAVICNAEQRDHVHIDWDTQKGFGDSSMPPCAWSLHSVTGGGNMVVINPEKGGKGLDFILLYESSHLSLVIF